MKFYDRNMQRRKNISEGLTHSVRLSKEIDDSLPTIEEIGRKVGRYLYSVVRNLPRCQSWGLGTLLEKIKYRGSLLPINTYVQIPEV